MSAIKLLTYQELPPAITAGANLRTLLRHAKHKRFPAPLKIVPHGPYYWPEDVIECWLEARVRASQEAHA